MCSVKDVYTWNWVWADTLLNLWICTSFSIARDHIFSLLKSEVGLSWPGPSHQWSQTCTPFCSSWPVPYAGSSVGAPCCRIKEVHFIIKLKRRMVVKYAYYPRYTFYLCNSRCWSKSICRAFLLSGSIVLLFSSFSIEQLSHLANLFSCNNTLIFITEADGPNVYDSFKPFWPNAWILNSHHNSQDTIKYYAPSITNLQQQVSVREPLSKTNGYFGKFVRSLVKGNLTHNAYCWNGDMGVVFLPQVVKLGLAYKRSGSYEFFTHPVKNTLHCHGTWQMNCHLVW